MGVTNELFALERANSGEMLRSIAFSNATPEDSSHVDPGPDATSPYSDIQLFAAFMELLARRPHRRPCPRSRLDPARRGAVSRHGGLRAVPHPDADASPSPYVNQGSARQR